MLNQTALYGIWNWYLTLSCFIWQAKTISAKDTSSPFSRNFPGPRNNTVSTKSKESFRFFSYFASSLSSDSNCISFANSGILASTRSCRRLPEIHFHQPPFFSFMVFIVEKNRIHFQIKHLDSIAVDEIKIEWSIWGFSLPLTLLGNGWRLCNTYPNSK